MSIKITDNVNLLKKYIKPLVFDYTEYPTKAFWNEENDGVTYEKALEDYILEAGKLNKSIKKGSTEYKKFIQEQREKLSIQRFKGLGEMNPEELWETTLNPDNRTMLRVQYSKGTKDKSKDDQKIIKVLMGDEVAPRKDFITNNALDVANLDI